MALPSASALQYGLRSSNDSVISAGDDRYWDISDEAGPLDVLRSRMPKLKAAKGSVFN